MTLRRGLCDRLTLMSHVMHSTAAWSVYIAHRVRVLSLTHVAAEEVYLCLAFSYRVSGMRESSSKKIRQDTVVGSTQRTT